MKAFLKENPTLVFGLGLPLLLVVILSAVSGLSGLFIGAPKYDVIFATQYSEGSTPGYRIAVINGKLNLSYVGTCGYYGTPEIYRYSAKSGAVSRVDFSYPTHANNNCPSNTNSNNNVVTQVAVPALANVTLNNANPAPDGYEFTYSSDYSRGGLLPELLFFRSGYYGDAPILRQNTHSIRIPLPRQYYSYYNVRFIGWVEAQ